MPQAKISIGVRTISPKTAVLDIQGETIGLAEIALMDACGNGVVGAAHRR